jgi:hypothetical protein
LIVEEDWLEDLIEMAKVDFQSALAKVMESQLPSREKQGISMALRGISFLEGQEGPRARPSTDQLVRMKGSLLLDPLDASYIRTWLVYARLLGAVKDEGGVKAEHHEPEKEVRAPSLGVQLSLTLYDTADEGPGDKDAEKVEKEKYAQTARGLAEQAERGP